MQEKPLLQYIFSISSKFQKQYVYFSCFLGILNITKKYFPTVILNLINEKKKDKYYYFRTEIQIINYRSL